MVIEPTSRAGALALLRFIAEFVDEWGVGDGAAAADAADAIRNALAVLEREARA